MTKERTRRVRRLEEEGHKTSRENAGCRSTECDQAGSLNPTGACRLQVLQQPDHGRWMPRCSARGHHASLVQLVGDTPNTGVKLPRFRGHRNIWVRGVHDGQDESSLPT